MGQVRGFAFQKPRKRHHSNQQASLVMPQTNKTNHHKQTNRWDPPNNTKTTNQWHWCTLHSSSYNGDHQRYVPPAPPTLRWAQRPRSAMASKSTPRSGRSGFGPRKGAKRGGTKQERHSTCCKEKLPLKKKKKRRWGQFEASCWWCFWSKKKSHNDGTYLRTNDKKWWK